MALIESIVVFLISLLIGAFGIYVGARIITNTESFGKGVVTALIGAIVWAVVGLLFGWVPFLGPLLALLAYVAVVNWQYPGGWASAAAISLIAWVAALVVLYVLGVLGIVGFEALGVPGA
ncbi:hypothetical protein ACFQH6_12395 [Halobacteriaceae archaeon GCM10025711]